MAECPWEALRDPALTDGAKTVLTVLWRYAGGSGRFVWPSRDTLGARCGMTPRTLRRHLAKLRETRWITEAEGAETRGNPGWHLCDPPGEPQHLGIEAAVGEHDRADNPDREADRNDRTPDNPDREEEAPRTDVTAFSDNPDRPYIIGTNPLNRGGGCAGARGESDGQRPEAPQPAPPAGRVVGVNAWRSEFVWAWRSHVEALGVRISDPTHGAGKVEELQRMLDEHGPDVVRDVLLASADEVARHHETRGQHGLHPGALAVVFRADRPQAFDARLDAWQRDRGRKRISGRLAPAPAELDGQRLTDAEQRAWMVAQGDDPAGAVRRLRESARTRAAVDASLGGLLGIGGAA